MSRRECECAKWIDPCTDRCECECNRNRENRNFDLPSQILRKKGMLHAAFAFTFVYLVHGISDLACKSSFVEIGSSCLVMEKSKKTAPQNWNSLPDQAMLQPFGRSLVERSLWGLIDWWFLYAVLAA